MIDNQKVRETIIETMCNAYDYSIPDAEEFADENFESIVEGMQTSFDTELSYILEELDDD